MDLKKRIEAKEAVAGRHRAGLRRAAAGRRARPRRRAHASASTSTPQGQRAQRRTQLHPRRAVRARGRGREQRACSTPTTDPASLADADIIDICVPTPLRKTRDPDLSYVVKAVETTAAVLRKGQLIILESTTYPGTTDEVVQPALEAKGLKAGVDFYLAFSPERVDPGNPTYQHEEHPEGRRRLRRSQHRRSPRRSISQVVDTVVPVSSTRVAEMVKLLENTFRAVNIGLVNELALMCHRMDIDVWEVIDAAKTKPFGFMPFYPGPGPGRPLHSDRSVLPVLEGAAERLRSALHRARRPGQRLDARVRRQPRGRGAERAQEAVQRLARARPRASPTSATSTTCASRRRSTSSSC